MTELTFLLELLLNHKLPKPTRVAVTERVKEVEAQLASITSVTLSRSANAIIDRPLPPHLANQAPSTIAAMMRHPDLAQPPAPAVPLPAQTPAAQAAMNQRQESINLAISGKAEKGRTSPRKF